MKEVPIPRYVDSQYQFLLWEIDEAIPIIAIIALGMVTETLTYMFVPGVIFASVYRKYKHSHLDGVLMHIAYHVGAASLNKRYPYGSIRFYEE